MMQKKGKIFTKIGREIVVAVRQGGPDPSLNSSLNDVINKAKSNNMPNDTITRAIKRASGEGVMLNMNVLSMKVTVFREWQLWWNA